VTRHNGSGNGPIDAFVGALGLDIRLMDYHEHAIGSGADARAACYVELRLGTARPCSAPHRQQYRDRLVQGRAVGREPPDRDGSRAARTSGARGLMPMTWPAARRPSIIAGCLI
jgi:hypothetical protein